MLLALLFGTTVLAAGFAVVRLAGVAKGALGFGLVPAAGLAATAIVASWCFLLGAPPLLASVGVYGLALLGLGLAARERRPLLFALRALTGDHGVALLTLGAAVLMPAVVMGLAFADAQVPLSPHDGAAHAETIQALRSGQRWADWYPPGMAALFAAWLTPWPGIDTALGALNLGMSLPLLAAVAVFGLGVAVWRDLQIAAAAALLLGFTYLFPYFPQLWSGWPLSISVIVLLGVWIAALEYLDRPTLRWAVLVGLLLGAIVLIHGTELYTLAIVLSVLFIGALRRVAWAALPGALLVASVVMIVCAAPYLPALFHWAGAGGAYSVGLDDVLTPPSNGRAERGPDLLTVFGLEALGIDLPIRLLALAAGTVWALRVRRGQTVLAVGLVFAALTIAFSLLPDVGLIRQAYATTYPWGQQYRTLMLVGLAQVLLAAAGAVAGLRLLWRWTARSGAGPRRVRRTVTLLTLSWFGLMVWSMYAFVAFPAELVLGYSPDDAAAMRWLRENARTDEVLANDRFADAGIWAPYKAGVGLLWPRLMPPEEQDARALVIEHIAELERNPSAAATACALHVTYVYYGARVSGWDERRFPPLDQLRASPALEEVYSHGDATVFRLRIGC